MLSINEVLDRIENIYFVRSCSISEAIQMAVNNITNKELRKMGIDDLSSKEVI